MHPFRAALTAVLMLVVTLITAGPAAAGGPTSALLAVPGEGATASLYYTDPEYDALAGLVGAMDSGGIGIGDPGPVDDSGLSHENGPGVTVTWLVHDVTPWRVDRIYVGGKGAPWIATQVGTETGSIWDGPVVWHQPNNATELVALLDRLGVGEAARSAATEGGFSGVAGAPVSESTGTTESVTEPDPDALAESSAVAGIWWGLGGLAGGVLLTLLWLRPRRGGPAPPEPELEPTPDADGAPVSEELTLGGRRS